MFPNARVLYDQDAHPGREEAFCPVAKGVVGWESADEHHDLGTSSNDGHSFVRVTLFRGKVLSPEEKVDNKPHGLEILCKVGGPLYWIPPKGTPVLVAFPDGELDAPGCGVIMCSIGPSPGIQFKENKPKLDFGPNQSLHIKAQYITLSDYNNNHIMIGNTGLGNSYIRIANGKGTIVEIDHEKVRLVAAEDGDCKSYLSLEPSKVQLVSKGNGYLTMEASGTTTLFGKATAVYGGLVLLGKAGLNAGFPVVLSTTAPTPSGAPAVLGAIFGSPNVFISCPSPI